MPQIYDDPADQPRIEEAFEPSGEDTSVIEWRDANGPSPHVDVNHRVSAFTHESMRFAPESIGHVVTKLPVEDREAGWIGELFNEAIPYIQEVNRFADVPGQLLAARLRAMQLTDPVARQVTLEFLERIKQLPLEDQQNLLLFLQGYRAPEVERAPIARGPNLPQPVDVAGQLAADVFGAEYNQDTQGLEIPDVDSEIEPVDEQGRIVDYTAIMPELITQLFPNIDIKNVDPTVIQQIARSPAEWVLSYDSVQHTAAVLDEIYEEARAGKQKGLAEHGSEFLRTFGGVAWSIGDIGWDIGGDITRRVPVVGDTIADFTGRQARAAERQIGKAIEPVITAGMEPIGTDPHTGAKIYSLEDQKKIDERAGAFMMLAGLGGIAVGGAIGKAGRRVRVARTAAGKEAARAALEARRSVRRGGLMGTAQEAYRLPIRKITEIVDKGLVAYAKNPEKFFSQGIKGRQGRIFLDTLDAAKKVHPGDGVEALDGQVGFVRQVYGDQMNERLVREMLGAPNREVAKRIFVDTLMNPEAGTKAIRALQKQREGVKTRLAELQLDAETRPARRAAAEEAVTALRREAENAPEITPELRDRIGAALDEFRRIDVEEKEISRLRLEDIDLDYRIKTTFDDSPMLRYPRQNVIRAAVKGAPATRLARILNGIFVREGRLLDPAKLVDELPRYPELHVQGTRGAPPNAIQANANVLSTYMRRAGVPAREIEQHLGELARTKTRSDFFELIEHKIFGKGGSIDRALPAKIDPELRNSIINIHDTAVEARTYSTVSRTFDTPHGPERTSRPVLGVQGRPGEYTPLPSRPSEFLSSLRLPDIDLVIQADSFVSRGANRLARSGKVGGAIHELTWRMPKFVLRMSTMIMKPLVMLVRLPAMALRIQLEQSLRIGQLGYKPFKGIPKGVTLFPGGVPVPLTRGTRVAKGMFGENGWKLLDPDPRFKDFSAPEASDMGMFMSEMLDEGPVERVVETTYEFRTGRRTPKVEHWEAFRKELEQANADFVDQKLAQLDLDEDVFLDWMNTDFEAGRFKAVELSPELKKAYPDLEPDAAVREWAKSRIEYLKQLTREDPKFLQAVATGKSRVDSRLGSGLDSSGRSLRAKNDELVDRLDIIGTTIKEKLADRAPYEEIVALQNERLIAQRSLARLQRENPSLDDAPAIELSDKSRWRNHVRDEWVAGRMELPDRLLVEKRLRGHTYDGGVLDDIEKFTQGLSNAMYRPFKLLSYADKHGTRGSLFTQLYARWQHEFRARGLDTKTADAMAYARAGELTKDFMYDLTARTSAQRALADFFWFAPAWQEVLYTWLVKLPAEAYWPVGAASIALKGAGLIDVLTAAGVVQKNSDGERVVVVPGLGALVEKLTGQKVPDIVFGKLEGLNLVTTGGGVPGLSTPANFALGKAALDHGGVFKSLSDVFQPYGPDTTLLPQPITFFWEALTGSPPPLLSPERVKADWDRSFDLGIQYAFSELKSKGIEPPKPEDFGTKEADGTWVLSDKQQQAYEKANRRFITDLMDLGQRYARGIAFVRLAGSTVAPMSLYATSSEREEWEHFWNSLIVPEGFGDEGLSDRQRDLIDDYVSRHPNSFAYTVFYRGQGEKVRDLPFPEDLDDGFFDSYYTGESRTLAPQEFQQKLLATEARRYYQAQLEVGLKEISPNNDPWELLTGGFNKKDALSDYREAWERWLHLNPLSEALLIEQSALWRQNNDVPIESFEKERIGDTLHLLDQIAPMLTGTEGIRPEHLRRVRTDLSIIYSEQGDFGAPNTETEKAIGWWFSKVFDPYIEQTTDLYERAQTLQAQGINASHIYDRIKKIQNQAPPKYKGEQVPSVEAMFFGNRNEDEREAAIVAWRSRPVNWLTDFQLEKAGYDVTPELKSFLDEISSYDNDFYNKIENQDISFSSNEYDDMVVERERFLSNRARELGVPDIWRLNEAAPIVRINRGGFGGDVPKWGEVSSTANNIYRRIEAEGNSPRSFSEFAEKEKIFFYRSLTNLRNSNKALDDLFIEISHSFPLPKGGWREGSVLYEALFFGNFNEQYIPSSVAEAGFVGA